MFWTKCCSESRASLSSSLARRYMFLPERARHLTRTTAEMPTPFYDAETALKKAKLSCDKHQFYAPEFMLALQRS